MIRWCCGGSDAVHDAVLYLVFVWCCDAVLMAVMLWSFLIRGWRWGGDAVVLVE